jgi:hypothetical protein
LLLLLHQTVFDRIWSNCSWFVSLKWQNQSVKKRPNFKFPQQSEVIAFCSFILKALVNRKIFFKYFFGVTCPFWLSLLFLFFFCHQVVHLIHLVFRWTRELNTRPRTMPQTVSPWCSPLDQGASPQSKDFDTQYNDITIKKTFFPPIVFYSVKIENVFLGARTFLFWNATPIFGFKHYVLIRCFALAISYDLIYLLILLYLRNTF